MRPRSSKASCTTHLSLWLNQHPDAGERIAQFAIENAQERTKAAQQVKRKRITAGPALPGKLADCTNQDPKHSRAVPGRRRLRRWLRQAGARSRVPGDHAAARQDPEHLGSRSGRDRSPRRRCTTSRSRIGVDPAPAISSGLRYHKICILADADSDGLHIATLLCALFLRHFRPLVANGHVFVAMPPLYRIDAGKNVFYALDDAERDALLERIESEETNGKPTVTRFKGLGEMNPSQLRETTMDPRTRRLVQLTIDGQGRHAISIMDMLLAKKRASDRTRLAGREGQPRRSQCPNKDSECKTN